MAAPLHCAAQVLRRADSAPPCLVAEPATLDRRLPLLRLRRLPLSLLLLQGGHGQRVIPFYGRYEPACGVLSGLTHLAIWVSGDLRLRGLPVPLYEAPGFPLFHPEPDELRH